MSVNYQLSTGCVSPQYHLIFDNPFETYFSTDNNVLLDDINNQIMDSNGNFYNNYEHFTFDEPLVYHPSPLYKV